MGEQYPDAYWLKKPPIQLINEKNPIKIYKTINIDNEKAWEETGWGYGGHVCGLSISDDGELLAGAAIVGSCFIWDATNYTLLQMLRDTEEKEIEEIYCVKFIDNDHKIITCGKLKSRTTWSEEDNDNFCIPGHIKIYDVVTGEILLRMEGHQEEILSLKYFQFKNKNFLLTCGQDGRIIKWTIESDFKEYKKEFVNDLTTNYACSLSFIPNTANKFFLCGCDEGIKVFDIEHGQVGYFYLFFSLFFLSTNNFHFYFFFFYF